MSQRVVDWGAVASVAAALAPPGPAMTRSEVEDLVADLRFSAEAARDPVATTARLSGPATGQTLVVDRAGWAASNARSFGLLVDPVLEKAMAARPQGPSVLGAAGRAVTAVEMGAVLAFVSTKILGQYDVVDPAGHRLLLVAPNIAHIERVLGVDPTDFRLWVCLHEETHRAQFSSTGWLADWFTGSVTDLVDELVGDPGSTFQRFAESVGDLPRLVRTLAGSTAEADRRFGLLELVQTPEQRVKIESITAVMSLLEGHADVVMDEVGPAVVPTVADIRARFNARRRNGSGPLDRGARRALGLDAKAGQYSAGARFVRAVTDVVGVDGFNEVWRSPDALPSPAEIAEPLAWVRRVHS